MGFFTTKTWSGCKYLGILVLAACIGLSCRYFDDDESGSIVSDSQLLGTWLGTVRLASGTLQLLTITIDEVAAIVSVNGDPGTTGTLVLYAGGVPFDGFQLYEFSIDDGATIEEGGFYVDTVFKHATVIFKNGDFAVLQRSASLPLPTFNNLDLQKRKTGVSGARFVTWDSSFEVATTGNWVFYTSDIAGSEIPYKKDLDPPPIIPLGYLTLVDGSWGVWEGLESPSDTRPLVLIMSADKDYAGGYECDLNDFPECEFSLWRIVELGASD